MYCRNLLHLSFDAACLADSNGHLLHANEPFLTLLGLEQETLEKTVLSDIFGQSGLVELQKTGR